MFGGQFFLLLMNAWCLRLLQAWWEHSCQIHYHLKGGEHETHKKMANPSHVDSYSDTITSLPVFAAELTEADVEQAVAEQGKETVTGNVFIWFLCAIAFLKVSQKIDSFMASLGINVGNTGGNMMAELLIAGRGISNSLHARGGSGGGGGYRKPASPGDAAVGGSFLSGGLAGSVGRHVERSAVNAATGYTENASIGNTLYQSSLQKGGDFANHVISNIAKGNYGQVGSIKGEDAANAYLSYMGLQNAEQNIANSPQTNNYVSENSSHTSKEDTF